MPETFWQMTCGELMAYYEGYKAEEKRRHYRTAMICSMLAGLGGKKTKPEDFMPKEKEEKREQSSEEMAGAFLKWAKMQKVIDKR